jgi:flagellar biosynthesis chaperone FliJ
MNAYRFRLETVLRLRLLQETSAREKLHHANVFLLNAIAHRDRGLARFSSMKATTQTMTREELLAELQQEELAAGVISSLQSVVGHAATEVVHAQLTWSSARRSVKALERLDNRRRRDYDELSAREQANDIDDIVSAGYLRRTNISGDLGQ